MVVRPVDAAVVLLPQATVSARVEQDFVDALADLRIRVVRHKLGGGSLVLGGPGLAAVLGAEDARGGDADVHPVLVGGIELDRVGAHPTRPGIPLLARRMVQDTVDDVPALARVVRTEEHARRRPEPDAAGLGLAPRLDVPRLLQLQVAVLGQREPLRAGPGLAVVSRAVDGRAVDGVVARRVQGAVTRVLGGVVDLPAIERWFLDRPGAAVSVCAKQEKPFTGPRRGSSRPCTSNRIVSQVR